MPPLDEYRQKENEPYLNYILYFNHIPSMPDIRSICYFILVILARIPGNPKKRELIYNFKVL